MVAIPQDCNAQNAEARGCAEAIRLLLALRPPLRRARIVGDNVAVIRYGAGNARLRRIDMQAQLEPVLAMAYSAGWVLDWQAVRRSLNMAADSLATQSVYWAARLTGAGKNRTRVHTTWHDSR